MLVLFKSQLRHKNQFADPQEIDVSPTACVPVDGVVELTFEVRAYLGDVAVRITVKDLSILEYGFCKKKVLTTFF